MNAPKGFSIGAAVKFGWGVMKNNLGFFIGLLVVVILINIAGAIVQGLTEDPVLSIIVGILSWIVSLLIGMGIIRIALRFCDGEKGRFGDLFSCYPLFFKFLFGVILYTLIVLGGTILLVVPGIIWGIKFKYFAYFIVDQGLGPIEALERSAEITRGAKWDLLGFWFVQVCIIWLGILCCFLGTFAAVPTVMVAQAVVYRELLAQTDEPEEPQQPQEPETSYPEDQIEEQPAV